MDESFELEEFEKIQMLFSICDSLEILDKKLKKLNSYLTRNITDKTVRHETKVRIMVIGE